MALKTNGVKVPLSICYLHVFYFRLLSFFIDDKVIANDLLKNSVCYCCQNLLALKPLARVSSPLIADFGRLVKTLIEKVDNFCIWEALQIRGHGHTNLKSLGSTELFNKTIAFESQNRDKIEGIPFSSQVDPPLWLRNHGL